MKIHLPNVPGPTGESAFLSIWGKAASEASIFLLIYTQIKVPSNTLPSLSKPLWRSGIPGGTKEPPCRHTRPATSLQLFKATWVAPCVHWVGKCSSKCCTSDATCLHFPAESKCQQQGIAALMAAMGGTRHSAAESSASGRWWISGAAAAAEDWSSSYGPILQEFPQHGHWPQPGTDPPSTAAVSSLWRSMIIIEKSGQTDNAHRGHVHLIIAAQDSLMQNHWRSKPFKISWLVLIIWQGWQDGLC